MLQADLEQAEHQISPTLEHTIVKTIIHKILQIEEVLLLLRTTIQDSLNSTTTQDNKTVTI